MPTIRFVLPDGQVKTVQAQDGETILRVAIDNAVPMEYACGGNGF